MTNDETTCDTCLTLNMPTASLYAPWRTCGDCVDADADAEWEPDTIAEARGLS